MPISEADRRKRLAQEAITLSMTPREVESFIHFLSGRAPDVLADATDHVRSHRPADQPGGAHVAAGPFPPGTLERVRTEDDAYRVFEPNGVGTGSITYDPMIGAAGHLDVTGTLSRDFDPEHEAQMIWALMKRGRDAEEGVRAAFDRLEHLYRRLAPSTTRPKVTEGGVSGA